MPLKEKVIIIARRREHVMPYRAHGGRVDSIMGQKEQGGDYSQG